MSNIINIDEYYIRYKAENAVKYGIDKQAQNTFSTLYEEAKQNLMPSALESQINAIRATLIAQGSKAAGGLQVLDQLQSGTLIEEIYQALADSMNENINKAASQIDINNYEQILALVNESEFSSSLAKGFASTQAINSFFNLILEGVTQAGKFNLTLLDQLTDIGKALTGTQNFQIDQSWRKKATIQTLSQSDSQMAQRIINYLTNAVERFQAASYKNSKGKVIGKPENTLSKRSFTSTITQIFSTALGEKIGLNLLAKSLKMSIDQADEKVQSIFEQAGMGKGKLTLGSGRYQLSGARTTTTKKVSKSDILNSRALNLTVTIGDQDFSFDLGANTSVKWYQTFGSSSDIHIISGSPLGQYLPDARGLAYNTITHRRYNESFYQAYRSLRASVAASFINDWLTGSGTKFSARSLATDRVQFLLINGKFYSVFTIIRRICERLQNLQSDTHSASMPFNMAISDVKNEWIGTPNVPNWVDAKTRSDIVTDVINHLSISGTLNANILADYV